MYTYMFGNVHIMHLINNIQYKNFESYKIHFERATRKMIFFPHLVDFLYSLGLKFVAPSVEKMCRKFSCKKTS
jgi:hypothetical protein